MLVNSVYNKHDDLLNTNKPYKSRNDYKVSTLDLHIRRRKVSLAANSHSSTYYTVMQGGLIQGIGHGMMNAKYTIVFSLALYNALCVDRDKISW